MRYQHKSLITALMITSLFTSGAVWAASEESHGQIKQEASVDKDFSKLSADGSRAFQDVILARLAIFDGRVDDAKTYVKEADQGFGKAKSDDTVFVKAEADLKTSKNQTSPTNADQMKKPIAWLPVDGSVTINEDFSANKTKVAAVADANKSLKNGDHKAAMEKLKLADIDVDVTIAVLPLQETISDVHQAATLINDGKYYEGSQMLKQAQDNEHFEIMDISGLPKKANAIAPVASAAPSSNQPATSAQTPAVKQ